MALRQVITARRVRRYTRIGDRTDWGPSPGVRVLHSSVGIPGATEETEITELLAAVDAKLAAITPEVRRVRLRNHIRKALARQAGETVQERLMARPDPAIEALCEDVLDGECGPEDAVRRLMGWVL